MLTELAVPLVAVIASLLGILVALDQITAGSRLRRQAAFWREMAQNPALPHDAAVFHSLERETIARVIALQAQPARILLLSALVVTTAVVLAYSFGFTIGQIPPAETSWAEVREKVGEQGADVFFWLLLPIFIVVGIIGFLNVILLRSQIERAYLDGRSVEVIRIHRDDRLPIDALGWTGFFQLVALSVGLACMSAAVGGTEGARSQAPTTPPALWILLFLLAGSVLIMWAGLLLVSRVRHATAREWQHPRPLPRQPRRPERSIPAGSSQRPQRWSRPRR